MSELTTERLEKRIKNCIEVGNGCVMLPVSVAEELLAYRKTVNHLLDNDGSRGKFSAMQSYDAREDLERLLAPTAQQNEPQNIPAQPVIPERPELRYGDNVLWFLNELAAFDASDIDSDDFDVYGEDRNGIEGCATISITELAADAAKLLSAQPVSNPYKLPSGYTLVPCKLTAENGAKSCMIGEFTEQTEISCPECFGDDECETCDGSGMIEVTVPISWTTIKDIWAKGIEHFAAAPAQEQK